MHFGILQVAGVHPGMLDGLNYDKMKSGGGKGGNPLAFLGALIVKEMRLLSPLLSSQFGS